MKNYHETTDGLIIPFEKVILIKANSEFNLYVRVVMSSQHEEHLDLEETKIVDNFKKWLER